MLFFIKTHSSHIEEWESKMMMIITIKSNRSTCQVWWKDLTGREIHHYTDGENMMEGFEWMKTRSNSKESIASRVQRTGYK